jgi:hypothetical protein
MSQQNSSNAHILAKPSPRSKPMAQNCRDGPCELVGERRRIKIQAATPPSRRRGGGNESPSMSDGGAPVCTGSVRGWGILQFEADSGPHGGWYTKRRTPQSSKRRRWSRGLAGGGERDYANTSAEASKTMAYGRGSWKFMVGHSCARAHSPDWASFGCIG